MKKRIENPHLTIIVYITVQRSTLCKWTQYDRLSQKQLGF